MYAPVVVYVTTPWGPRAYTACSIECARHHGFEPSRLAAAFDQPEPCVFCGFLPEPDTDYPKGD